MKLFYSPGACSLAVHIMLEEIGAKTTLEKVDRNNKTAEHLAANPMGTVPTLILDNGKSIAEGVAVLQYLADQHPEKNLAPKAGTWERAKFQELLNFLSTEIHKSFGPFFSASRYGMDEANTKKFLAVAHENMDKRLKVLDERLAKAPYLDGNHVTIADFYLFTLLRWSKSQNISLAAYKNIQAFQSKIVERPGVQKAMQAEGIN